MQNHPTALGIVAGFAGAVGLGIIVWLVVVYTGAYDVAATDAHADVVRWTLDTTLRRSVERRAREVELPERASYQLLQRGARHYAESCAHCHGAPGQDPAEWSRGMRPEPPHLAEAATDWTPEEIHWIVSNGIKMSGMPAFAPRHDPEELVELTTFVTALPGLSADDYEMLTGSTRSK